jgi:hypothetical protein
MYLVHAFWTAISFRKILWVFRVSAQPRLPLFNFSHTIFIHSTPIIFLLFSLGYIIHSLNQKLNEKHKAINTIHTQNLSFSSFLIYPPIINSFIPYERNTFIKPTNITHYDPHPSIHPSSIIHHPRHKYSIMMNNYSSYSSRIVTIFAILSVILFVQIDDVVATTARHTRSRALRGSYNINNNSNSRVVVLENNINNNRKLKQNDNDKNDGKNSETKDKNVPSSPKPAPIPAPAPVPVPVPLVPVPVVVVPASPTFAPLPTPTFSSFVAPSPTIPIPAPVPVPAVQADKAPTPGDVSMTEGRIIDEGATATSSTTTSTTITTASSSCETEHVELQECIDSSSSSGGFEICKSCIKAASKLPTMSTFALNSCVNDITMCNGCQSESENYYNCYKNPTQQSNSIAVVIVTAPEAAPAHVPATMVVPAPVPVPVPVLAATTIVVPAPAPVTMVVPAPVPAPVPVPAATTIVVPAPAPAPVPVPAAITIVVPSPVLIDESTTTATIDRTPDVVGRDEDSSTVVSPIESLPIIGVTWSHRFDSACRTQQVVLDDCTGGNSCKTCIKAATQLLSTSSFALNSCIEEVEYCYGCSKEAVAYYECGKDVV